MLYLLPIFHFFAVQYSLFTNLLTNIRQSQTIHFYLTVVCLSLSCRTTLTRDVPQRNSPTITSNPQSKMFNFRFAIVRHSDRTTLRDTMITTIIINFTQKIDIIICMCKALG